MCLKGVRLNVFHFNNERENKLLKSSIKSKKIDFPLYSPNYKLFAVLFEADVANTHMRKAFSWQLSSG